MEKELKKMKQFRQGDIFLKEIDKIPEAAKSKDKILAMGEITGHKHQFLSEQVTVFKDQENQYVEVQEPVELTHEEHATIVIPEGKYIVIPQREFDIMTGIRQVMD